MSSSDKSYYIRTYFGGFIEVTKKQFLDFVNTYNISSALDHDDMGYTNSDLYKLNGVLIGYVVYKVYCDEV